MKTIKSSEVIDICDRTLAFWHKAEKKLKKADLDGALAVLNFKKNGLEKLVNDSAVINCFLWHLEDQARAKSFSDSFIAGIKRAIDTTNQRRNNKMEEIDATLLELLKEKLVNPRNGAKVNTETPGSVVDRLAIISLKIYHMRAQVKRKDADKEHRTKCKNKVSILIEQRSDLARSFDELLNELKKGTKKLKMYYQLKMYNDPSTNPFMNK